jgi:hypothetical protein
MSMAPLPPPRTTSDKVSPALVLIESYMSVRISYI